MNRVRWLFYGIPRKEATAIHPPVFEYEIDASDVITQVNRHWEEFAEANDAPGLGARVVGTWLWKHFAGMEVKYIYRTLLERVRESGQSVSIPFRCDSPELRRRMSL